MFKRIWRSNNPMATFTRIDFNECCVKAIAQMQIDLKAELARWQAGYEAWLQEGSIPSCRPKRKEGNAITRMYKKTGWWPLVKDSELWQKAISTLGPLCAPANHKLTDKPHKFADLGDKRIKIRALVLKSIQQDFLDRANRIEERAKAERKRKRNYISIENTFNGKGFTKCEVGSCFRP